MARAKIDYPFAAIPLEAIGDPALPPPAFELFCLLCKLAFLERDFTLTDLASMLAKQQADGGAVEPPGRRSIYRWLTAIEAAGWITWERYGGTHDRFTVHGQKRVPLVAHVPPVAHACVTSGTLHVSPVAHVDRDVPHQDAVRDRAKTPDQNLKDSGGGGGGRAHARELPPPARSSSRPAYAVGSDPTGSEGAGLPPALHTPAPPAADGPHPESVALLTRAGAKSAPLIAAAARLPPDRVRQILAEDRAAGAGIGRTLRRCAGEAEHPELAAHIAAATDPTPDPGGTHVRPRQRPRSVGPGRGRVPIEAAQPASHLTERPLTTDETERIIAEGLAEGERLARRLNQS